MNITLHSRQPPDGCATILLVDDTPENLVVLGELLQPYYRVRAVNSGERALRAVHADPLPDLILLDIMMPGMDGYEVLRQLRADRTTADIPVIFVTAIQEVEDELYGFELGAADFIHKPIKGPIVLSRIRAQLDAKAAREILKKNNERLVYQVEAGTHALEQAQLQLLQSEKLAAMGQLAAGIAHEINNPIGYVGSNLSTLENYLQDIFALVTAYDKAADPANPEAFAEARKFREQVDYDYLRTDIDALLAESKEGIARVRRIVQDLKDFSRVSELEWQWADLEQGIDSTLNIVWNELKYHCTVKKQYANLPKVRCLPSQLNQVFMNLLVNAAHAIEGRGEIVIETAVIDAQTVGISFSDTGKGMTPEVMAHIFDAFFTTKPVGKGTGLGLSLVWSIIERHHGRIEVKSEVGKGTTFTITLPIDAAEAAQSAKTAQVEGADA